MKMSESNSANLMIKQVFWVSPHFQTDPHVIRGWLHAIKECPLVFPISPHKIIVKHHETRISVYIYIFIILYYIISYYIISYYIILSYIILYHIILYYVILYHIISYYLILYYIILYHIVLYHIISYYLIPYYIISFLTNFIANER